MAETDVVFHLAAAVGVKLILAEPIESFRTNVLGTEAVLARGRPVRNEGTDRVHVRGVREGRAAAAAGGRRRARRADVDQPVVVRGGEDARRVHRPRLRTRGLPVVCFRLFNTVGPRQSGRTGWSSRASWTPRSRRAAARARRRRPVALLLHVDDAVSAIVKLERSPRAVGEVFNVGATEPVTIRARRARARPVRRHGRPQPG